MKNRGQDTITPTKLPDELSSDIQTTSHLHAHTICLCAFHY